MQYLSGLDTFGFFREVEKWEINWVINTKFLLDAENIVNDSKPKYAQLNCCSFLNPYTIKSTLQPAPLVRRAYQTPQLFHPQIEEKLKAAFRCVQDPTWELAIMAGL